MSEKLRKITLEDLMARVLKTKDKPKETKQLYIKSLDGLIIIQKPDRSVCFEALDMEDSVTADEHLVYECVIDPNLKSTELHKAFGVVRPADIVNKIFEPGEVAAISKQCLAMAGYIDSVKPVEDIKNS